MGGDGGASRRVTTVLLVGIGVLLVCVIATVVLSVIVLTKVSNSNDNNAAPSPPPAPSSSPASPTLPPPQIGSGDLYNSIAATMSASINFNGNPCTDFYDFACGSFNQTSSAFGVLQGNQEDMLIAAINAVQETTAYSWTLRYTKRVYNSCLNQSQAPNLPAEVQSLQQYLPGKIWPMMSSTAPPSFSMMEMWTSVAQLSITWMANTFLTPYAPPSDSNAPADTNWRYPNSSTQPHLLYIDQATLYLGNAVSYSDEVWPLNSDAYEQHLNATLHALAPLFGYSINENTLIDDIRNITALERALATISKSDDARRNYTLMYNPFTVATAAAQFSSVPWAVFFAQFTQDATSLPVNYFTAGNSFVIVEPDFVRQLNDVLLSFSQRTIANYLGWRLMDRFTAFIPATSRLFYGFRARQFGEQTMMTDDADLQTQRGCVAQIFTHLPFAAGRLIVDATFKGDAAAMRTFQTGVRSMIAAILNGFRAMLSELPWMQRQTLTPAYAKIDALIINPGWPDWQQNDTALDQAYVNVGQLQVSADLDWFTAYRTLLRVHTRRQYQLLMQSAVDRAFFEMSPAIVNAWYQPERNSISFPLSILNPPFYAANYPTALNLGGLGAVIGHELTHGFDDEGVQWTSEGALLSWLDSTSSIGFNRMAQCIQKQYSGYCPPILGGKQCVNGVQTQGENIADNGGIRAAFRAYKNLQSLNGQDSRLPGRMSEFSQDQLFFLSFGQVWCSRGISPSDEAAKRRLLKQLLTDAHAPAQYRVKGTLDNFPQFAAAFNCPPSNAGHCNIWVGDNQP